MSAPTATLPVAASVGPSPANLNELALIVDPGDQELISEYPAPVAPTSPAALRMLRAIQEAARLGDPSFPASTTDLRFLFDRVTDFDQIVGSENADLPVPQKIRIYLVKSGLVKEFLDNGLENSIADIEQIASNYSAYAAARDVLQLIGDYKQYTGEDYPIDSSLRDRLAGAYGANLRQVVVDDFKSGRYATLVDYVDEAVQFSDVGLISRGTVNPTISDVRSLVRANQDVLLNHLQEFTQQLPSSDNPSYTMRQAAASLELLAQFFLVGESWSAAQQELIDTLGSDDLFDHYEQATYGALSRYPSQRERIEKTVQDRISELVNALSGDILPRVMQQQPSLDWF